MKFVHRLGYYLGGFVIGLMLLFFFLGGKKSNTSLDSCKQYVIKGFIADTEYKIRVENCETKATVLNIMEDE